MSIAEQIMLGTQQQSKNWSVLSENLGRLGQQVGQQLAMREYQKQAAEALPAMQAAYRSAMDDVSRGSVSEGYQKFIDAQLQFGTSQNPFIAGAANNIGGEFTNFVKVLESQKQRQAQYGDGGPVYEVPSLDELRSGQPITPRTVLPAVAVGTENIISEGRQPAGQPEGYLYPEGQPLQGTPEQRAQQAAAQREMLDQEAEASLPKQDQGFSAGLKESESPFEFGLRTGSVSRYVAPEKYRNAASEAFYAAVNATPEQRRNTRESITEETEVIPENAYRGNIPGFGDGYIVGPSMERGQELKEEELSEEFTAGGRKAKRSQKMGQAELTEAQKVFQEFTRTMGVSTGMFRYNKQLAEIMEAAGGDPTKIQIQEDEKSVGGEVRKVTRAFVNGVDLGVLSDDRPQGADGKPDPTALSEAGAVRTMISAQDTIARFGGKFIPIKKPATAQPSVGEKKERFPEKKTEAPSSPQVAAPAAAPAKEMTLEERISAKTAAPTSARKATPEQLVGVKASQVRQQKSDLESEVKKLERALYDMPRAAGGKKQLKRGLSAQDPDVKSALQRIAEINKQLEAL